LSRPPRQVGVGRGRARRGSRRRRSKCRGHPTPRRLAPRQAQVGAPRRDKAERTSTARRPSRIPERTSNSSHYGTDAARPPPEKQTGTRRRTTQSLRRRSRTSFPRPRTDLRRAAARRRSAGALARRTRPTSHRAVSERGIAARVEVAPPRERHVPDESRRSDRATGNKDATALVGREQWRSTILPSGREQRRSTILPSGRGQRRSTIPPRGRARRPNRPRLSRGGGRPRRGCAGRRRRAAPPPPLPNRARAAPRGCAGLRNPRRAGRRGRR
jgi:hypothetical protein